MSEESGTKLCSKPRGAKRNDWNFVSSNTDQSKQSGDRQTTYSDQLSRRNSENNNQSERKKVTELVKHVELLWSDWKMKAPEFQNKNEHFLCIGMRDLPTESCTFSRLNQQPIKTKVTELVKQLLRTDWKLKPYNLK